MTNRTGQMFGKYRLKLLLGKGAFGEVYLAEKIRGTGTLGSLHVAIKILYMQLTKENFYKFLKEANKFSLNHPNIVQIRAFDIENDLPYIVMSYAPNGTLRQRHPRGIQVPLSLVINYVNQIANALQYIHDEELVHRDLKPENFLIGENNEILLGDFGIAIMTPTIDIQEQNIEVVGTPYYMAPEQFLGQPRRASDQYALGMIVYEWLSGSLPFGGNYFELMGQQLQVIPTPLHEKISTIMPDVSQVVQKVLSKDPKDRFENVSDFAKALEDASKAIVHHSLYSIPSTAKVSPTSKKKEQWLSEGNANRSAKNYTEALTAYNYAIQLDSKYTGAFYNRGLTYYFLKEFDLAIADYNQALLLNSKYALVYYSRGMAYEELKKYDTAIADYDNVIILAPDFVQAYYNRGLVNTLLSKYNEAVHDFLKVTKINSRHTLGYYNCGLAYLYLNNFQQAIRQFDQALQLNPEMTMASIAREAARRMLRE